MPGLGQLPPGLPLPPGANNLASLASAGLMPPTSAAGLLALSSMSGMPHLPPGLKDSLADHRDSDKLVS